MLELSSVSKSFGGLHVLHDVNLSVPQGHLRPDRPERRRQDHGVQPDHRPAAASGGAITFNGDSLLRRAPQITRMGIARTFQNIRLFKEMTLLENVVVGAYAHELRLPSLLLGLPGFREHEAGPRTRPRAADLDAPGPQGQ